jgi:hypothetical protein
MSELPGFRTRVSDGMTVVPEESVDNIKLTSTFMYRRGVMKHQSAMIGGTLLIAGLLVAGCHKNDIAGPEGSGGSASDFAAIKAAVLADPFVQNDEVTFSDQDMEPTDYGTFGKIDAAITPLRWGRFISGYSVNVTTTVDPGDTTATATVQKTFTGTLKIRGITGAGDTVVISKDFTDSSTRNVLLRKHGQDSVFARWIPVASSLIAGGTTPPPAGAGINITQVQLFIPGVDTITVTDPTDYYLRYMWLGWFHGGRRNCPSLGGGEQLTLDVTVVSASPDTDIVALRYGFDLFGHRRRQHLALISETDNGDGTFTRVYRSNQWFMHFNRGFFTVGIDALTKGTLFDDAAPYSVSWWGLPYRVL